jgi:Arylsulfotransferase (ASST)
VYELDGRSDEVLWQLGGAHSSFAVPAAAQPAWQHDARMQPDGTVTLFDNGSNPRVHPQSRALHLAIDARARTVTLLHSYAHPQAPLLSDSQGNMQTLPDGNLLVGWGAIPSVSEFAPSGALLFDAHMPPGTSSYRAFRFPWSGRPSSQPAVNARVLATEDQTAVFASWNGATDIASWRVLAGLEPNSLEPQATARFGGFESTITYPENYLEHHVEYVAVQALDAKGDVLGTSPTVAVAPPSAPPKG